MPQTRCGFNDSPDGSITGRDYLVFIGPTLMCDIGFDPAYVPGANMVPVAGAEKIQGLVDTGAGESCIDSALATTLALPIVDRRHIAGAGGRHEVNMYLAQIHVPSLVRTIHGQFAGVELSAGGQRHSALIGRTFLQNYTMTYEGKTGTVVLSSD